MPVRRRRTVIAAALAITVLGAPLALAHAPRDARPGAPRMDLEVLVTPVVTGRTTPGGTDAVVSVDGFGNRFAMARKETAEQLVGVDQRSRTMVRAAPWLWTSADNGASWDNLDLLPRGADTLIPEGSAYAVASEGAKTYFATATPAGTLIMTVTATRRARFGAVTQTVIASARGLSADLRLAPYPGGVFLVSGHVSGTSVTRVLAPESQTGATLGNSVDGTSCAAGARARAGKVTAVLACLEGNQVVLQTSTDAGTTFTRRVLGSVDTRGGDRGSPSVDLRPDGSALVMSGLRLWRVSGRTTTAQDLRTEAGTNRATTMAVSHNGRIGVAAYRKGSYGTWNIVVTVFIPGVKPVWSDFAYHDPVSPAGAAGPPSDVIGVDFDEQGRIQVLWTSTLLHQADLDRPLLRNIWSIRSTSS